MTEMTIAGAGEYEQVMDVAFAFGRSQALFAAIELDVFSVCDDGPLTPDEVASRLQVATRGITDLLDTLAGLGLLRRESGRYATTQASSMYLARQSATYVGDWLRFMAARLYPVWQHVVEAIRTGLPQNEARTEPDYYANLGADRQRHELFLSAMAGLSARPAELIAHLFPWERAASLVDLGGAVGVVAKRVVEVHPHVRGTVFDLPSVEPFFHSSCTGAEPPVTFVGGDFFVDPLPSADVFVLGHVLHNWNEAEKTELLRRAFTALNPGGAVVVYESLLDDERTNMLGLIDSLTMRLVTRTGGGLTRGRCVDLLQAGGAVRHETLVAENALTVIVGWKDRR